MIKEGRGCEGTISVQIAPLYSYYYYEIDSTLADLLLIRTHFQIFLIVDFKDFKAIEALVVYVLALEGER